MHEFDIKRFTENIIEKKFIILAILIISIIIGAVYSFFIKQPIYTSKSKIVLEKADASANELVKSDIVLKEVIDSLKLQNINIAKLRNEIMVTYTKETKMIQIAYSNMDNELAKSILAEITRIYMIKLNEVYNIKNAKVIEEPILQEKASNINHIQDMITTIALAIIIIFVYIFIYNTMDTTIRNIEDVEKLDINLLGIIPKQKKGSENEK